MVPVGDETPPEEPLWRERDGLKYLAPLRARAFLGLVRAGRSLVDELDAQLRADHGLGLYAFEVLLHLAVFSDGQRARMAAFAARLPLSQSRVSRLVAELERGGLVARQELADDRRGVEVALTPAGLDRFRQAQETALAGLDEHLFSQLSWSEVVQLAAITDKLLAPSTATDAGPAGA